MTRVERFRRYCRRFVTQWVKEDPDPGYSSLDQNDGLGKD